MIRAGGHRTRHCARWGDGETLNPHQGPAKDKYWLRTVLITFLNWAILVFPVGSLWKIHAGSHVEREGESWAWRTINHCRYIIHWKHVKRTRQDALDHWKQHLHRSWDLPLCLYWPLKCVTLFNLLSHLNDVLASVQLYCSAFYFEIWWIWTYNSEDQISIFSLNTGNGESRRYSRTKISLSDSVTAVVLVTIPDMLFVHSSLKGQGQWSLLMWGPRLILSHHLTCHFCYTIENILSPSLSICP